MIEIRTISQQEIPDYLNLLCKVFNLEYERAHTILVNEPLFDLNRKWALFDSGKLVTTLTTTHLEFGYEDVVGIAGVATEPERQGEGLAGKLIQHVLEAASRNGEMGALLFATDGRLYANLGFEVVDTVVRGPILSSPLELEADPVEFLFVRGLYRDWAEESNARLRRDQKRWKYWNWFERSSFEVDEGYFTTEGGMVREALWSKSPTKMPVIRGTEWVGLSKVTNDLQVPLGGLSSNMMLMGRGVDFVPEFFMTDQF
ncbi:MAG TPA: GNAT family N-acetyltransferase [Fimbriimonas sp.]|nr:GNAT family N-acetyltransferase [Fimbriimonas sp.]